jgi:hypothetical protein
MIKQGKNYDELFEDAITFAKVDPLPGFTVEVLKQISYINDPLKVRDTIKKRATEYFSVK